MNDSRHQMNLAITAIKNKEYARAREILKFVLISDPDIVEAWLLYARVALEKEQAIQCLERVLKLDPTNSLGLKMLGQLEAAQNQTEQPLPNQPASKPGIIGIEGTSPSSKEIQGLDHGSDNQSTEIQEQRPAAQGIQKPRDKARKGEARFNFIWVLVFIILCSLIGGGFALSQNSIDITNIFNSAPTPTSDELFAVINRNISAANSEDIAGYMETIHTKSPLYKQTEESLMMAFSTYDLLYSVSDLKVEYLSGSEAKIHFVLTSRKISGPTFRDNAVEGVFILRPEDGVWKLYQYENLEVTYLN
jgi:tetratricopeptide (TPR) repeat protein